jgi:hypothetical protein
MYSVISRHFQILNRSAILSPSVVSSPSEKLLWHEHFSLREPPSATANKFPPAHEEPQMKRSPSTERPKSVALVQAGSTTSPAMEGAKISLPEVFSRAVTAYGDGKLSEAEWLCRRIVRRPGFETLGWAYSGGQL